MNNYQRLFNYGLRKPMKLHLFIRNEEAMAGACIYLNCFREKRCHLNRLKAMYKGGRNVAAIEVPYLRDRMTLLYEKCFDVKSGKTAIFSTDDIEFINSIPTEFPF